MRWGALLWTFVSLAGCHDRPGLLVEVAAPAGTDHVELYLSTDGCGSGCPSITPPAPDSGTATARKGVGWIIDDTVPYVALDASGARFKIETATDTTIDRALAVGFDAQGVPTGAKAFGPVDVPAGGSVVAQVRLAAADPLDSPSQNEHVQVWQRPMSTSKTGCAVVQQSGTTEFFVPKDDTDCDDVSPQPECAPFVYRAASVPPSRLQDASCFRSAQTSCVLGGTPCSEQSTLPPVGCAPLGPPSPTYCLPGEFCMVGNTCSSYSPACLTMPLASGTPLPSIACDVQIDVMTGAPCPGSGQIGAREIIADTQTTQCKALELGTLLAPPSFDTTVQLDGITVTLDNFQSSSCTADITVTAPTFQDTRQGMAHIVTNGGVHRVIPFVMRPHATSCGSVVAPVICLANHGSTINSLYSCQ